MGIFGTVGKNIVGMLKGTNSAEEENAVLSNERITYERLKTSANSYDGALEIVINWRLFESNRLFYHIEIY